MVINKQLLREILNLPCQWSLDQILLGYLGPRLFCVYVYVCFPHQTKPSTDEVSEQEYDVNSPGTTTEQGFESGQMLS